MNNASINQLKLTFIVLCNYGDCTGSWTQRFWEWKSHVLTDRRYSHIGAGNRTRTYNLLITNQLRYHCAIPASGADNEIWTRNTTLEELSVTNYTIPAYSSMFYCTSPSRSRTCSVAESNCAANIGKTVLHGSFKERCITYMILQMKFELTDTYFWNKLLCQFGYCSTLAGNVGLEPTTHRLLTHQLTYS